MWHSLLLYIIFNLIILFIIYFTGHCFTSVFKSRIKFNVYQFVFIKLITGLISIVFIYSVFKTGFKTINLGFLIIFLFFLLNSNFRRLKKNSLNFNNFYKYLLNDLKILGQLSLLLLLFYFYKYFLTPIIPFYTDLSFNVDLAMYLNFAGIETLNWNYIDYSNTGNSAYHYFESWFLAFTVFLFNSNYWQTVNFINIPILIIIVISGTWSIISNFKINYFYKILSILIIFISGYYHNKIEVINILKNSSLYGSNAFNEFWVYKLLILYIFILFASLFILKKKYIYSLFVLLCLPIISIALAPTILILVSIIILLNSSTKMKFFEEEILLIHILYPISIVLYIIIFYKLTGSNEIVEISFNDILYPIKNYHIFNASIDIFAESFFSAIILYLPIIIIVFCFFYLNPSKLKQFLLIRSFYNNILLITIFVFCISFFIWQFFYYYFGSYDMFYYPSVAFINIISFFVLYFTTIFSIKKIEKSLFLSIFIISFIIFTYHSYSKWEVVKNIINSRYSENFTNKVHKLTKNLNPVGIKIDNINDYVATNPFINVNAFYLYNFFDEFSLISLNFHNFNHKDNFYQNAKRISVFYKFIQWQKNNNIYKNKEQVKLDFIKEFNIDYMVVSSNSTIDSIFIPYIKEIVTDPNSKEKFVLLNKLKL